MSCNLKNRDVKYANDTVSITKVRIDETIENQYNWIDSFPEKIRLLRDSFYRYDLKKDFHCAFIDEFFYDMGTRVVTTELIPIDSTICKILFENDFSVLDTLGTPFLYSIERPFMSLYPITIINPNSVVERPLILVLFSHNGEYLNSIEVADSYGEGGGCLESRFINDSVMIQTFDNGSIIGEFENENIGELGVDYFEISYPRKVTFRRDGTYEINKID